MVFQTLHDFNLDGGVLIHNVLDDLDLDLANCVFLIVISCSVELCGCCVW